MDELLLRPPYSWTEQEKKEYYSSALNELTAHHRKNCPAYARLLRVLGCGDSFAAPEDLPFLPVSLFKEMELRSIPEEEIYQTLTSSGTTGQLPSRIYLDRETSRNQQRALIHIVSDFLGTSRLPMLVLDSKAVLKDPARFSARAAGIVGFSVFSSSRTFALDENMKPDIAALGDFAEKYEDSPVLLFGFTYIIWREFLQGLRAAGISLDLPKGILIHGGGWKKLAAEAVSGKEFKEAVREQTRVTSIYDYYGMAEQTGSIFMACEEGHFHASIWSDVIIRNPRDYSVCPIGEEGVVQVVSVLPRSYPGHSLLTEDLGVMLGEDDCPCGRKGRYFRIPGRIPRAEIRGCSDTYGE